MNRAKILFIAGLMLFPLWAGAQEKREKKEPKSNFSSQLWYQFYYFQQEDAFKEIYGREYFEPFGISFGGYPIRNLGINLNIGYAQKLGYARGELTGETSGEKLRLILVPIQLELNYRFDFLEEQLLVPSVSVGGDWWYYKEHKYEEKDVEGDKSGWHAGAGLSILLDRIDPTTRFTLQDEFGIENVFLHLEVRWCWLESGDGLDLSGVGYSAGLLIEY